MIDDDAIPLEDGEITGCQITPESRSDGGVMTTVRTKRKMARKNVGRSFLCFGATLAGGKTDQAACPIVDISTKGLAFEYDQEIKLQSKGFVAYRSVSGRPVHITCVVRRCIPMEGGRFLIGVLLDRKLQFDEIRPAQASPGREIAPNLRPRKLRDPK